VDGVASHMTIVAIYVVDGRILRVAVYAIGIGKCTIDSFTALFVQSH